MTMKAVASRKVHLINYSGRLSVVLLIIFIVSITLLCQTSCVHAGRRHTSGSLPPEEPPSKEIKERKHGGRGHGSSKDRGRGQTAPENEEPEEEPLSNPLPSQRHFGNEPLEEEAPEEQKEEEEESIEDVDDPEIDDIVSRNEKNLVVILYDNAKRCPQCAEAVKELEEIDDDLEDIGTIEVVKTDDKSVARELGVQTFPALVYFRRRSPIFYDGEFKDSKDILRWIRIHDDVATLELNDDNFEDKTDSANPDENALDWFVMFYNSKDEECNSFNAVWETVAHKLRGLVKVGKVDIQESDDVSERFKVERSEECPDFIFFRRGKMYRYKDTAEDVQSFISFALNRYKEVRGHRVPDPPTLIEEVYEDAKERMLDLLKDKSNYVFVAMGAALAIFMLSLTCYGAFKLIQSSRSSHHGRSYDDSSDQKNK